MSLVSTLRQTIAPELNYLYLVPPFATQSGMDCGWFSREHALHAFFVARLSGAASDLRTGDFAALSRSMPPLTSMGTAVDHAWCAVGDTVPVDLSMTFALLGKVPQLAHAIVGEGKNGDWEVRYARDESLLDEKMKGDEILFIERTVHAHTPDALLDNPYAFIAPPQIGETNRWHAWYGPDIYAKISLHAFRCASDASVCVRERLPRLQAMAWIAEHYPAPEAQIRKLIAKPA